MISSAGSKTSSGWMGISRGMSSSMGWEGAA